MNGLSIHFSLPEVITCLWTLFLLGTSHTTVACLPVCRDVYLPRASANAGCRLIFTLSFPTCKLIPRRHLKPLSTMYFKNLLNSLTCTVAHLWHAYKYTFISSSVLMLFCWMWSNSRIINRYSQQTVWQTPFTLIQVSHGLLPTLAEPGIPTLFSALAALS